MLVEERAVMPKKDGGVKVEIKEGEGLMSWMKM
jgi:hypothetical protein